MAVRCTVFYVNRYGGGKKMLLSTFWTLLASNGSIKSNFVNAGSLTQKNSLLLDMKYMDFYGRLPGIKKYFVAAGISYWRDFVIMGFDCNEVCISLTLRQLTQTTMPCPVFFSYRLAKWILAD